MVRLVLFDIDGTLVHTDGAGIKAFGRALETQFKIPNGTAGMVFAGKTDSGLVQQLFSKHGINPTPYNFQLFYDIYTDWLAHLLTVSPGGIFPGVLPLIEELKALPEPPALGLLTGNIRLGAEIKLRHFDIWEHFRTGAFADDHHDRNEIAAIAQRRGSRLLGEKLRGDQVVVIGDTPLDIACGKAIGAKVVAVATGTSSVNDLAAHHPEWAVPDLRELSARVICPR